MGFKRLAAGLMMMTGLTLLAACGGSGGSDSNNKGKAQLRLVNASSAYTGLDLKIGDTAIATGVAYGGASAYAAVEADTSLTMLVQSGGTTLTSRSGTLTKDRNYALVSYGWAGNMKVEAIDESQDAPADNYSKLQIVNVAETGKLDVYLTQNVDDLGNATPTFASTESGNVVTAIASGSYRVRVTAAGSKTDLRLNIPTITLSSKQIATLVITPTQGGVLVSSLLMTQQGATSAQGAGNARARVVSTVADNATVTATLGGTTMLANNSKIGDYQIITAGQPVLNATVAGVAIPARTTTLAAGSDYTLLIWGPANAPQVEVLADDNRLPAASTAKFRVINGLANQNGGLTLTLDYSAIASNVAAGKSSTIASVTAPTTSQLSVFTPDQVQPIYNVPTLAVQNQGVYTVFMMGSAAKPEGILRKDR